MNDAGSSFILERALISKIVLAGQIEKATAAGLTPDHFGSATMASIYEFVAEHSVRYGSPPSHEVVGRRFPDFDFEIVKETFDYLADQFKNEVRRRFVTQALEDVAIAMTDPKNLPSIEDMMLQRAMKAIELMPQPHTARYSNMPQRIDEYQARKAMGMQMGIRMGIPLIDRETFGIQPNDFVSISGWQGIGKSTLAQHVLFHAYLQGKTPMIFSMEMGAEALLRRWDTMKTNFKYADLKGHSLDEAALKRWEQAAGDVSQRTNDIIIMDAIGACTVDFVHGKMQAYKPDLVCIDYISLMTPPRRGGSLWEEITQITQALKQIARRTHIPIIAVAQTNKESAHAGAQLDNISYSRSIGQDSDIALGLFQDDEMKENNQMGINLMKNRDGRQVIAKMLWKPETMEFREWTMRDKFAPKDDDDS